MRQAHHLLAEEAFFTRRDDGGIGDDVVNEGRPRRSRIAEVADLQRRRAVREDARSRIRRVALQIDGDVHLQLQHLPRCRDIVEGAHIDEAIEGCCTRRRAGLPSSRPYEIPMTSKRARSCS